MKIRSLRIQNYKKFVNEKVIQFTTDGEVNEKTLLVGENGSGKTSILQAIVFLLSSLTKERFTIEQMNWQGFDLRLAQSGKMPMQIEAEIEFSDEEIENTRNSINQLIKKGYTNYYPLKSVNRVATVIYDFQKQKVVVRNKSQTNLFKGYQYAKMLTKFETNTASLFDKIGNIYWYNDLRMADDGMIFSLEVKEDDKGISSLDRLRNYLAKAYLYHISKTIRNENEDYFDLFEEFNKLYTTVFPGRKFVGALPKSDRFEEEIAPEFFLSDGKNEYELSELSAGERAIFPILMDFARKNINNSIIIIDEIELHLHPPLQQQLIRVLSKLGDNNQFIFTSHSDSVYNMFTPSEIFRLENE